MTSIKGWYFGDFMKTPLWYNPKIETEKHFFPSSFKAGIINPADIVDNKGTLLPKLELENS